MNQNELVFDYDKHYSKFVNNIPIEEFTQNEEQRNKIIQLLNYFSEDKIYKKLSTSRMINFIISLLILLKIIIFIMIFLTDLSIYKIKTKNDIYTQKFQTKNNFNYSVIFGFCFIVYFLFIVFLLTHENLKYNLFKKISKTESEALLMFSTNNLNQLKIFTAHNKKRIFCFKFFCVYNFKFVIKRNISTKSNLEKVILINNQFSKNDQLMMNSYEKFDETFDNFNQSESIDFHNMSN